LRFAAALGCARAPSAPGPTSAHPCDRASIQVQPPTRCKAKVIQQPLAPAPGQPGPHPAATARPARPAWAVRPAR
jgi:hypothetical protein